MDILNNSEIQYFQRLSRLENLYLRSGFRELWVVNAFQSLKARRNDRLFIALFNHICKKLQNDTSGFLPFEFPLNQCEIEGQLNLGRVLNSSEIKFMLPIDKLRMHILVAGFSGSGKTNFAKILAEQAILNNIQCIKIIDPKADDYDCLAYKYWILTILRWHHLKLSIFVPPPGVPFNEWIQTIISLMSQSFNFWVGSESFLLKQIITLKNKNIPITVKNLIQNIYSQKTFGQKDVMVKSTVLSRLELLQFALEDVLVEDSKMLEELSRDKVIISTSGLMIEID